MKYSYTRGESNIHYLEAPYRLLVKAFGDDGFQATPDEYKVLAEWHVPTPRGRVEVYSYLSVEDPKRNTDWHVQGDPGAIEHMLHMLAEAGDGV